MSDKKVQGLTFMTNFGSTMLFGSAIEGVNTSQIIPVKGRFVGFTGKQALNGDIFSLSTIELTCNVTAQLNNSSAIT